MGVCLVWAGLDLTRSSSTRLENYFPPSPLTTVLTSGTLISQ